MALESALAKTRAKNKIPALESKLHEVREGEASTVVPNENFIMPGDYASQKYLGSKEGVVLSGKLAAKVICYKATGRNNQNGLKKVHTSVQDAALHEGIPMGIKGVSPFSFGGDQQGNFKNP